MLWLYASLIAAAPLYIWRFELVGLPTNFFMVYAFIVACIGGFTILAHGQLKAAWQTGKDFPSIFRWAFLAFYLASIVSLFVGGFDLAKLGQWLVVYALPMKLAAQMYFYLRKEPDRKQVVLWFIYAFLLGSGITALVQYFWLVGLPTDWWGNSTEPKRAIGFFIHPNNLALFITPLLAYTLPDLKERLEIWWNSGRTLLSSELLIAVTWLGGAVALLLSLSRGGWLGLLLAGFVFVVLSSSKKLFGYYFALALIAAAIVFAVPNLRYRLILPFYGEKSSVARLSLWETGTKMIKDSPILGQGINGFNYNWNKFNTDSNLNHYNFPHNFILNTWVELGLLGLISWLTIVGYGLWFGLRNRTKTLAFGLLLFLIALLAHGLIDIPYFKNDLAMIFWLIFALSL